MKHLFRNIAARGVIHLFVLVLVSALSLQMIFPLRVAPADSPADVFSAQRAMTHLDVIAREPHPQGSAAQQAVRDYLLRQLTLLGLEAEVQLARGAENVVARLYGTASTGAILILTHYDSTAISPGAGDNGSGAAALVEVARALAEGPALMNDVIFLFDDSEELPDAFTGSKAFVREHRWMSDVRVAISLDTAVAGFISTNEVGPNDNGWLVQALARAYDGGIWTSFSGGGKYDSTPFRNAGVLVLALEDNYPFRQKHTAEDTFAIVRPASVQQMGEQTLAIVRELGLLDLTNPRGEQETFFTVPCVGLVHYPQAWSLPLAIASVILLFLSIGLVLWRRLVSWRGVAIAFGTVLALAAIAGFGVSLLKPLLPGLFGWETSRWPDWPEVIPPGGGLAILGLDILVLGLVIAAYVLVRRWIGRMDFAMAALIPFSVPALLLAIAEPRTAYAFLWPVCIGALGWITVAVFGRKAGRWLTEAVYVVSALPLLVLLMPFLPGLVMSDGMKSLEILAVLEAFLLGMILPVIDALLVRPRANR